MSKVCKEIELIPNAHLLLSSLRSMGYTEETAIADIIDNCIAAEAENININFDWDNRRIVILDDGKGMSEKQLLDGMRIGSANPNQNRDIIDLGRFGMGMKTAAFSLGKKLTLITKEADKYYNACWDLEYIQNNEEWNVIILDDLAEEIVEARKFLNNKLSGTVLMINNLDKLVDEDNLEKSKVKFYKVIKKIKKHVSLVFHRFIEEDNLNIKVNNKEIFPWNPFVLNNKATQELPIEEFYEDNKYVTIEPFILPHKTKFNNEDEFKLASGANGWDRHQGFYVYRNRRLLVYGTWFNRIRKETVFNLARIKLDITSDSDFDWSIDIKKSKATPPVYLDEMIDRVIDIATSNSAIVYNSRGLYAKKATSGLISLKYVWEQRKNKSGKYMFYINKKHPLLLELYRDLDDRKVKELKSFLSLLENYAPSVLSGIIDTMGDGSSDEISEVIKEKDIIEITQRIEIFRSIGFSDEEILEVFETMPDYLYLYDEMKKILIGEGYE